ncbi:hypothetical protein PIB30_084109 [Stylosanthes scabra]|uniref:Uncharacterized protein n=1 Tax=Stylosanthes scabra TaxID=79078 RepID=A0ABU6QT53_9FABA|nr:hypothetical protein [Stylosanthes scabra]
MANSIENDEVNFANLSNNELLDIIDDLTENFGKLFEKYAKLKKENEALKDENAQLSLKLNKIDSVLKIENEKSKNDLKNLVESTSHLASENQKLKTEISCLNNDLAKFTHGSNNLDELLAEQMPLFVKSDLGYVEKNKTVFKNDFEASTSKQSFAKPPFQTK